MRTTLDLDDDLMAEAMRLCPGKTKSAIIHEALTMFVAHHTALQQRAVAKQKL
jgi:Arc/MetJ family transcription regulator